MRAREIGLAGGVGSEVEDVAVDGEADAAEREERREIFADNREDRYRQQKRAITAREVADDCGEQYIEKATANLFAAIAGRLANARNSWERFPAVRALSQRNVN